MLILNRQIVNGKPYRYAYQGQEKDPETGKEAFQLRLWDARIGRWLSPDPYGQYHSPYNGMGNDPINGIDPDGGWKTRFGAWWFRLWNGTGGDIYKNAHGKYGLDFGSGGKIDGVYFDNINLVYSKSDYNTLIADKSTWTFNANGNGLNHGCIAQWNRDWKDKWGASNNFFAKYSYDLANGIYTTSQVFIGRNVGNYSMRNIDGTATTSEQGVLGFVSTATLGYGQYVNGLKAVNVTVKSSPKLYNIFSNATRGQFTGAGHSKARAEAYRIALDNLKTMIKNHNLKVNSHKAVSGAIGKTQDSTFLIDYFFNKK